MKNNNIIIIVLCAVALIGLCFAPWSTMPKIGGISLLNMLQMTIDSFDIESIESMQGFLVALFFIFPLLIILGSLTNKKIVDGYKGSRLIAIIGLLGVIVYMIIMHVQSEGLIKTAWGAWVSFAIYILIIGASQIFINQERDKEIKSSVGGENE